MTFAIRNAYNRYYLERLLALEVFAKMRPTLLMLCQEGIEVKDAMVKAFLRREGH